MESVQHKMKDFSCLEIFRSQFSHSSIAFESLRLQFRVISVLHRVYIFSFYGIADLMSFFPFYIELIFTLVPGSFDSTIFRIFRLLRLFQLEHWRQAFSLLDDVFFVCKDTLARLLL